MRELRVRHASRRARLCVWGRMPDRRPRVQTYKHVSSVHSLTVADVDGSNLTVRQLTPGGDEVDRFVITK